MTIVKDLTTLNAIGKRFHLTFDRKHKYCTSNAYVNDAGENIPPYLPYIVKGLCKGVYRLQYFDGCFNPFLCKIDLSEINDGTDRIKKNCNHIMGEEIFPGLK